MEILGGVYIERRTIPEINAPPTGGSEHVFAIQVEGTVAPK